MRRCLLHVPPSRWKTKEKRKQPSNSSWYRSVDCSGPLMFSDGDVLAISSRFDTAHQEGLFSTVKGCVVGARCTQAHLVSIAVHPGYEAAPRSIDLYVEQYLYPPTYAAPAAPRNLEHAGSCIRRYPHGAPRLQRNNWAIFTATKAGRGPIDLPVNDLYESYKCEDGVRTVWGNIVVVKTDRMGEVCDMVEKDIGVAELLIYSLFEDDNKYNHPLVVNPLVSPKPKSYWGWQAW
ncbi:hypothetical protein D9611_012735 [Ephemerocybe angulata]|uniref:Uncharacterized protein n=1 Tax=Ephemerocybe angulata TaxID=980116 RepID=A0A8H5FJ23_9AGAR|nr:hypothetical protein D9611_012735 [Tulosesus angulatus]